MTPKAATATSSRALPAELESIDRLIEEFRPRLNVSYFSTTRQVALRLQRYLVDRGLTLQQLVDRNLGQEIVGSAAGSPSYRELCGNCLRSLLEGLCRRGHLALAFERCVLPYDDLNPHSDPRGLTGYAEAVMGIYPCWLIPERFQRAIDSNARVHPAVRGEFQAFAVRFKSRLNEATLRCYWENIRDLSVALGLQSLNELSDDSRLKDLQRLVVSRGFYQETSTLVHWRRVLRAMLGDKSPFERKDRAENPLVEVPDRPVKPVIKDGASFHKKGKRHTVIEGVITECRIRPAELRRLVHFESRALSNWQKACPADLRELFRAAQEDVLVKYWAIIKDRPAELMAHNDEDWKLYKAQADSPDSQMFNGDGVIFNNYRESRRKPRPDKPFPRWLAARFKELRRVRRAYFATKGDCDQHLSQETGLLREGIPLWVDPRTGRRATASAIRQMLRRGLLRAGLREEVVRHISGYWFRKGVISAEWMQGKLKAFISDTDGHSHETAERCYITEELAPWVVQERETYWKFLGINQVSLEHMGAEGGSRRALGDVKDTARRLLEKMKESIPGVTELSEAQLEALASTVAFNGDGRVSEQETATLLEVSKSTVRRWAALGLLEKFQEGGRVFFLKAQLQGFREKFVFVSQAAKLLGCSDSYLRRLCRTGKVLGARKVGKKSYLLPWSEVRTMIKTDGG